MGQAPTQQTQEFCTEPIQGDDNRVEIPVTMNVSAYAVAGLSDALFYETIHSF